MKKSTKERIIESYKEKIYSTTNEIYELNKKKRLLEKKLEEFKKQLAYSHLEIKEGDIIIPKKGKYENLDFKVTDVDASYYGNTGLIIKGIVGRIKVKSGHWSRRTSYDNTILNRDDFTVLYVLKK